MILSNEVQGNILSIDKNNLSNPVIYIPETNNVIHLDNNTDIRILQVL